MYIHGKRCVEMTKIGKPKEKIINLKGKIQYRHEKEYVEITKIISKKKEIVFWKGKMYIRRKGRIEITKIGLIKRKKQLI